LDIRQLELFLAVVQHGSVTRAAERVYLSPGAVSLQLHNLAIELHTDLFVRTGKRFSPTPAALRLAELARNVIREVRIIQQEFANDPSVDARPLHLATGATTLIYRLGIPLRMLRTQFPQTQIQVTVAATEEMVAGLMDRRFDLAIITLPYDETNLTVLPLFDEELLILQPSVKAVRSHTVRYIDPAELAAAKFLFYPPKSNMRSIIEKFFRNLEIKPNVVMEADDTEVIKKLVESGFGYAILPQSAVRGQLRQYHLYRVRNHTIMRKQAVVLMKTEYPRALAVSVARFLQSALGAPSVGALGTTPAA